MSTLEELIHYCRIDRPIGAIALYGESGCGKTYLIENDLAEVLRDTHFIVRISLFGISSIEALHTAVKKQWLYTCTPFLTRLKDQYEHAGKSRGLLKAINTIVKKLNPQAEKLANAVSDPLEYIVIEPESFGIQAKARKKAILVFDDADRTRLNLTDLLGTINDYCENLHFNTIIIANRDFLNETNQDTLAAVGTAKEKTVAYAIMHTPDYDKIVHEMITDSIWKTEKYGEFLKEHEQTVAEAFASDHMDMLNRDTAISKHHNIRTLIAALESFHRVYHHMTKAGIRDIKPYLYSFIAFFLSAKSGITKDKKYCYNPTDEEISQLYPRFSAECLFESVRNWVCFGYWNKESFMEELSRIAPAENPKAPDDAESEPL